MKLITEHADDYGNTVILTYGKCDQGSSYLGMLIAIFKSDTLIACTRFTTGMYRSLPDRPTRFEVILVLLPRDILRLYLELKSHDTSFDRRQSYPFLLLEFSLRMVALQ